MQGIASKKISSPLKRGSFVNSKFKAIQKQNLTVNVLLHI